MGSFQPPKKKLKLINMPEKTPVSLLQEFCVQENVARPSCEYFENEDDPKMFDCIVHAFNSFNKGSGRSKSDAKHKACEALYNNLAAMDKYKSKIRPIEYKKEPAVADKNAVGELIELCMQRGWQSPVFIEKNRCGEAHKPEFTFSCKIGSKEYTAKGMTKQNAKRMAAEGMLKLLDNIPAPAENETSNGLGQVGPAPLPFVDLPTIEEVLAAYRRLKKSYIKPITSSIRFRNNFFLKLPLELRSKASDILLGNEIGTAKEMVHLVCKALRIEYKIGSIRGKFKTFELVDCSYDCVIVEVSYDTLFEKVIDYFMYMLNLKHAPPNA